MYEANLNVVRAIKKYRSNFKALYPNTTRGLSARSVRRYVKRNGLREEVEERIKTVVQESVHEVSALIS